MTKTNQVLKLFLSFTILISTAAFKRGDVIQTETVLRGRTSANFVTKSNIRYRRLPVGTVGRVLKVVPFHNSGNEGVQILLQGPKYDKLPESQRKVWVYNWTKRSNDLKQCKDESCGEDTASMDLATHTRTLEEQPATDTSSNIRHIVEDGWALDEGTNNLEDQSSAAGTGCVNCSQRNDDVADDQSVEPAPPADETSSWVPVEVPEMAANLVNSSNDLHFSGGRPWIAHCSSIISNDGEIGQYGQALLGYMSASKYKSAFLDDGAMKNVCPRFGSLTKSQKYKAWLVLYAAIGDAESKCVPHTYHPKYYKGKLINHKEGWGMFAAELHGYDRDWRGSECQGDIKNPNKQIECVVSTTYDQSLMNGKSPLQRYWGARTKRMAQQSMNRIQECG